MTSPHVDAPWSVKQTNFDFNSIDTPESGALTKNLEVVTPLFSQCLDLTGETKLGQLAQRRQLYSNRKRSN